MLKMTKRDLQFTFIPTCVSYDSYSPSNLHFTKNIWCNMALIVLLSRYTHQKHIFFLYEGNYYCGFILKSAPFYIYLRHLLCHNVFVCYKLMSSCSYRKVTDRTANCALNIWITEGMKTNQVLLQRIKKTKIQIYCLFTCNGNLGSEVYPRILNGFAMFHWTDMRKYCDWKPHFTP